MKSQLIRIAMTCCLLAGPFNLFGQDFDESDLREDQVISLELTPTEPAIPALANRLFPEENELIDRNAAIYYHRAIYSFDMIEARLRAVPDDPKNTHAYDNRFMESPLEPETLLRMRDWLNVQNRAFAEIEFATHSKYCDWQLVPEEAIHDWFLLPMSELQSCRGLARMLAVKARIEIIDGRYEDAVKTIQSCFKMASDLQDSNMYIGSLVADACVGTMKQPLLEFIQKPDSPNLYWALATLPDKLTDSRNAIRFELSRLRNGMGFELLNEPKKPRTMNSWRGALGQYSDRLLLVYAIVGTDSIVPTTEIYSYPIAKQMLLNDGVPVNEVEAMPAIQVVAIVQARITEQLIDEHEKGLRLSDLESEKYFSQLDEKMREESYNGFRISEMSLVPHLDIMLHSYQQSFGVSSLLKRQLAALQILEAIRLHLGQTGELPKSLDDITIVPIPLNAETGQQFRYESDGQSAKLFDFGRPNTRWGLTTFTLYQITTKDK